MQTENRAVLFANGQARPGFEVNLLPGDFPVAVDGGLHHLKRLGIKPQLLIGDLDSVSAGELAEAMDAGIEIQRFPPEKDQTDLELALEYALKAGYAQIVIAYPFGDRWIIPSAISACSPAQIWQRRLFRLMTARWKRACSIQAPACRPKPATWFP